MDEFDEMNEGLDPNSPYYKQNLEILNSPEHIAKIDEQKRKIAEFKAMQNQPIEQPQVPAIQQPVATETTTEVEDPRLTEALDRQNKLYMYSNLLKGFQKIAQAPAVAQGFKPEYAGSDMLMKAGDLSVEKYKTQLALEKEKKKEKREQEKEKREQEKDKLELDLFQTKLAKSKIDLTDEEAYSKKGDIENNPMLQLALERFIPLRENQLGRKLTPNEIKNYTTNASAHDIYKVTPQLAEDVYKAMDYRLKEKELTSKEKLEQQKLINEKQKEMSKEQRDETKLQVKEDQTIAKENRKERKQLDKDLQTWDSLEKQIDDAIDKTKNYNKNAIGGTGALAKTKTYVGALAPETQSLNTSLQKLSMDQLVKQFSGMSKAIDTPAERAAFEATVPNIGMDNKLLMDELLTRKKAAQDAKKRISEGMNKYDKYGQFTDEETAQPSQQKTPGPGSIINSGGKRYRVGADGESLEEIK